MSHGFGNEWEEALDERYHCMEDHRAACDGKLHSKGTKAQKLLNAVNLQRRKDEETGLKDLWKMSKFQKTVTRLQKEAPLVRDSEGRLQRCRSSPSMRCSSPSLSPVVRRPSPAIREAASPPQLPRSALKQTVFDRQEEIQHDFTRTRGSMSLTEESLQHRLDTASLQAGAREALQGMEETAVFGQQDDAREDFQRAKDAACFGKPDDCESETESECSWTPWTPVADISLDASVEHRSNSESDTTMSAEGESPGSPSIAGTTLVTIAFTVRINAQEDLHLATRALQGRIGSQFSDSMVKLGEFAFEQPRQALREKRQRYTAWGQKALDAQLGSVSRPGPRPPVLSPVSCSLTVKHASSAELRSIIAAVVDCIQGSLSEEVLQVRKVAPAGLWESLPTSPPPRPHRLDGLGRPLALPKKRQVSYRYDERPCLASE